MKYLKRLLFMTVVLILLLYFLYLRSDVSFLSKNVSESAQPLNVKSTFKLPVSAAKLMAVAVVVCGDRWQETLVMIKSALLLTKQSLMFYIFTDEDLRELFQEKLTSWQNVSNRTFSFELRLVKFPAGEFHAEWRKLFKPCASQRLFLPSLLDTVDSVLYVDTDTMFLGPLDQVWDQFGNMNSTQLAALVQEHEEPQTGWYNRFAKHPFYKPYGVNSGVMLMNLTRMRAFGWERYVVPIYKKYKLKILFGDQDIINIIFHFHPDKLYIYSCKYNYRTDHCMYTSVCKEAEREGIVVLHGSRGTFHSDKHPPFRSVYKAMEEYQWGGDLYTDFYLPLETYLNSSTASNCGKVSHAFIGNVKKFILKDKR